MTRWIDWRVHAALLDYYQIPVFLRVMSTTRTEEIEDGCAPSWPWCPVLATQQEPGTPGVAARIDALSNCSRFPAELQIALSRANAACATLAPVFLNIGTVLHLTLNRLYCSISAHPGHLVSAEIC